MARKTASTGTVVTFRGAPISIFSLDCKLQNRKYSSYRFS